jgi:hypothetical protein
MDPNPDPRLRAQAAESRWFLLFACVVLLAPPLLAAVVAKRPVTVPPAADVVGLDRTLPQGVARQDPPPAPDPVADAPAGPAIEG